MQRTEPRGDERRRTAEARPTRSLSWFVLLALSGAVACSDGASGREDGAQYGPITDVPPSDGPSVYLRLRNATGLDFDSVTVWVDEELDYGALADDAVSDYLPAEGLYSYARLEARSGERQVGVQPTDFIGETPLGPGYYTYVLRIEATLLDIQVVRERAPD